MMATCPALSIFPTASALLAPMYLHSLFSMPDIYKYLSRNTLSSSLSRYLPESETPTAALALSSIICSIPAFIACSRSGRSPVSSASSFTSFSSSLLSLSSISGISSNSSSSASSSCLLDSAFGSSSGLIDAAISLTVLSRASLSSLL